MSVDGKTCQNDFPLKLLGHNGPYSIQWADEFGWVGAKECLGPHNPPMVRWIEYKLKGSIKFRIKTREPCYHISNEMDRTIRLVVVSRQTHLKRNDMKQATNRSSTEPLLSHQTRILAKRKKIGWPNQEIYCIDSLHSPIVRFTSICMICWHSKLKLISSIWRFGRINYPDRVNKRTTTKRTNYQTHKHCVGKWERSFVNAIQESRWIGNKFSFSRMINSFVVWCIRDNS